MISRRAQQQGARLDQALGTVSDIVRLIDELQVCTRVSCALERASGILLAIVRQKPQSLVCVRMSGGMYSTLSSHHHIDKRVLVSG